MDLLGDGMALVGPSGDYAYIVGPAFDFGMEPYE